MVNFCHVNNEDGRSPGTGAVDMGTGYLYTSVLQMVAEELGIRAENIHLVTGDTDATAYDHGIGGSRGVFTVGKAAQMAAAKAKEELFQEAAKKLGVSPERLETKNGRFISVTTRRPGSHSVKYLLIAISSSADLLQEQRTTFRRWMILTQQGPKDFPLRLSKETQSAATRRLSGSFPRQGIWS
jgi:CO/xanthine dehydrogenase Mo-binding subunit